METLGYILLALALSMVAFSVAVNSSIFRCIKTKEGLDISITFALFQGIMIALGGWIGKAIGTLLDQMANAIAIFLLLIIGMRMMFESRRVMLEVRTMRVRNSKMLLSFSFLVSVNAFLVGLSLGMIMESLFTPGLYLAGMTFVLTFIGIKAGRAGMTNISRHAEMIGGILLIIVGVTMVLQYLKIL